ncbi:MAG: ArgE/DapE family deacylase [Candidatus Omnitrophica bacterium]|nr:ArgE/DapE family deacylase [Candidatus Omnitrophota bacterium]
MKKILDYINSRRSEIVKLTKTLIEIPTQNPPGEHYEEMVRVIEKKCRAMGLSTKRFITPRAYLRKKGITTGSERINLIADWDLGHKETIHITCHYDVVPATKNWDTHPFKAHINKDKITGRGAEDMKGTLCAAIFAVEAIKALNRKPGANIQLSFCPDEETGGETGFGWLVKNGLVKATAGISEGYSNNFISIGNKGVYWFEVEVIGKSAHGSMPYKGINAFEHAADLAQEFKNLKAKIEKKKSRFMTKDSRDRFPTLMMGGEVLGGCKVNVVPEEVVFSVDRRLIPEETRETARRQVREVIKKFCAKNPRVRIRINEKICNSPCVSESRAPVCRAMASAVKTVTGKDPKFAIMAGATDLRFLMQHGIPCVGYSARGGSRWHSDNEYISIKSIQNTAKIYCLTILSPLL